MWIDSLATDLTVRFSACVRTNDHTARRHSTSHRRPLNISSNVGEYPWAVSPTSAVIGVGELIAILRRFARPPLKRVPLRSLGQPSCLPSDLAPLPRSCPAMIPLAPSCLYCIPTQSTPQATGKNTSFFERQRPKVKKLCVPLRWGVLCVIGFA
jgi:hypothetical protein